LVLLRPLRKSTGRRAEPRGFAVARNAKDRPNNIKLDFILNVKEELLSSEKNVEVSMVLPLLLTTADIWWLHPLEKQ
jgi:hypothetical protein